MAIRLTGLASGLDTESIIKELMSAQRTKLTKIENKKTKNTWKKDKWKELNTKIYALYTDQVSKMKLQGSYMTKKATSSNESAVTATAGNSAPAGTQQIEVKQLASAQNVTSGKVTNLSGDTTFGEAGTITITVGGKETKFEVTADTKVSDFITSCKNAGLNASVDATQGRIFLSAKESGVDNQFTITDSTGGNLLGKIGLGEIDGTATASGANGMTVVAAQDSKIILNGAELTGSTNSITANGITYQLNEVTDSPVSINVSNDTDAVYNMIKDFIGSYNSLLKEMNTLYYAGSSRGYEPLTDEEKEAMTDEQIELWENKIKDSLLRRDTQLGSVINGVKTAMSGTVTLNKGTPDEKTYSLASFGICTSGDYTEKGLLHIYGDADDSTYSSQEDKLRKALEEDPDTVMQVFSQLATNLADTMQDQMKKTSLSSALTFYNDKQLDKYETEYDKQISKMEDYLDTLETKYYNQFSAMETALAKLQSQQNALSGLFG